MRSPPWARRAHPNPSRLQRNREGCSSLISSAAAQMLTGASIWEWPMPSRLMSNCVNAALPVRAPTTSLGNALRQKMSNGPSSRRGLTKINQHCWQPRCKALCPHSQCLNHHLFWRWQSKGTSRGALFEPGPISTIHRTKELGWGEDW